MDITTDETMAEVACDVIRNSSRDNHETHVTTSSLVARSASEPTAESSLSQDEEGDENMIKKEVRSRSVTFRENLDTRIQEKRRLQRTPTPYWPRKEVNPTKATTDGAGAAANAEKTSADISTDDVMDSASNPIAQCDPMEPDSCGADAPVEEVDRSGSWQEPAGNTNLVDRQASDVQPQTASDVNHHADSIPEPAPEPEPEQEATEVDVRRSASPTNETPPAGHHVTSPPFDAQKLKAGSKGNNMGRHAHWSTSLISGQDARRRVDSRAIHTSNGDAYAQLPELHRNPMFARARKTAVDGD